MRQTSQLLAKIPRDPKSPGRIKAYLRKPPIAIGLSLIVMFLPVFLVGLLLAGLLVPIQDNLVGIAVAYLITCSWGGLPILLGLFILLQPTITRTALRISDEEFDAQLRYDVYLLSQRALNKIQLRVPSAGMVSGNFHDTVVSEPTLWCTGLTSKLDSWGDFTDSVPGWKRGSDGEMRYRIYRVSILYLANHHLAYYMCDFNVETGLILREETVDCHYKDVAAINFEEHQVRAIDLPTWWQPLAAIFGTFKISEFFIKIIYYLVEFISRHSDFSIRWLDVYLGAMLVRIPTRITERCESFEIDSKVDPVIAQIRFLLQQKRMSYVRLSGPGLPH